MKRIIFALLMSVFTLSIYSCRDTEMNTDGDNEIEDKRIEDSGEDLE